MYGAWHLDIGFSVLVMVSSILLACAGNHHRRHLLLDWGWGRCESHGADHNVRPLCNVWFGNWFSSSGNSSAAASSAAASGGREPFLYSLWTYICDKHGGLFHTALWVVGCIILSIRDEVLLDIWMWIWMRRYWPRLSVPRLELDPSLVKNLLL